MWWVTCGMLPSDVTLQASATVVMFNTELNHQRFFSGHDDDVMALCRHPSSDILASGQAGPRPSRVCVYDASGKDVEPISTFLPSTTAKGRRLPIWEQHYQLHMLDCKLRIAYSYCSCARHLRRGLQP